MPSVPDNGIEALRKSVEPSTLGSPEYVMRVRLASGDVSTAQSTEAHQDALDIQASINDTKAVLEGFQAEAHADSGDVQAALSPLALETTLADFKAEANANAQTDQALQGTINDKLEDIKISTAETTLRIGDEAEAAAASDGATSGLNGLLKRLLTRFTTYLTDLAAGSYRIKAENFEAITVMHDLVSGGGSASMVVNGAVTPQLFTYSPPAGETWIVGKVKIMLCDNSNYGANTFGQVPALSNGLLLSFKSKGGAVQNLCNLKTNEDLLIAFGETIMTNVDAAILGANRILASGMSLRQRLVLNGDQGDYFRVTARDDLTGLTVLRVQLTLWKEI
jgi:hypothetical protein